MMYVWIPLEFEAHYDFIAFLPSRVHGSGSLTKYWACDGGSFKVRGIEMRQHSTPVWVQRLQRRGLELLAEGQRLNGVPSFDTQRLVLHHHQQEMHRLKAGQIPLNELTIARRTRQRLDDYRVKNLTYAALMRAHQHGFEVPPGGKVHYVVLNRSSEHLLDRVLLAEEIDSEDATFTGCPFHYQELAERATWALLAPFGWTTEEIREGGRQPNLLQFAHPGGGGEERSVS